MGTDTDRHFIERMHWDEVARRIKEGAVAILPIGAAAKQHGFHLPLNTDRVQAEWLAGRMAEKIDALVWPTLKSVTSPSTDTALPNRSEKPPPASKMVP